MFRALSGAGIRLCAPTPRRIRRIRRTKRALREYRGRPSGHQMLDLHGI